MVSEQHEEAMFLLSPSVQKELGYRIVQTVGDPSFHVLILQKVV